MTDIATAIAHVQALLESTSAEVDRALPEFLPAVSPHAGDLGAALRHSLTGGKRVRPLVVREAAALLAQAPVNFVGNAEGRDIFRGQHDVVVCDGFVGNVLIKAIEGYGEMLADILRTAIFRDVWGRLSFNLMRPVLLNLERRVDFADYGGGLLLGVDGGIIICHGRSNARAICNAVLKGIAYVRGNVSGSITTALRDSVGMLPAEKE